MATYTNSRGEQVDFLTGQVIGEQAPAQSLDPRATAPAQDVPTEGMDRLKGLTNQFSWGFNSALFSLPDAAQRVIGKAIGMKDDEVFQFTKLFNRGENAPRNTEERFSRAVASGVGSQLPFTGILAGVASMKPMTQLIQPGAGVVKGLANDAIKFAQQRPGLAAATDIAFGAAYDAVRQAVEEEVDPENPYKNIYKEVIPMAAFMGLPMALNVSPMFNAAKKAAGAATAGEAKINARLGEGADKEIMAQMPGFYQMPVIRMIPKMLMGRAEKRLESVFGPITNNVDAQESLNMLKGMLNDPRLAQAGLVTSDGGSTFNIAEQTMYGPLLGAAAQQYGKMSPSQIDELRKHVGTNIKGYRSLMDLFAPQSQQPVSEALGALQQQRQGLFESLLRQKQDLTDTELADISARLGPQNMENVNRELRNVLMAQMEMSNLARESSLQKRGFMEGVSEEGLFNRTRPEGTSALPTWDVEKPVLDLVNKYLIPRKEMPFGDTGAPEPIRKLADFVKTQQERREELYNDTLEQLIQSSVMEQIRKSPTAEKIRGMRFSASKEVSPVAGAENVTQAYREKVAGVKRELNLADPADEIVHMLTLELRKNSGIKLTKDEQKFLNRQDLQTLLGTMKTDDKGNALLRLGNSKDDMLSFNTKSIMDDARQVADANSKIDLNMPEAMQILNSAIKYRNSQIAGYNAAMGQGAVRVTDAQRRLDKGEAVFNDVVNMLTTSIPKFQKESPELKSIIDDYQNVFAKTYPLLFSAKKKGGREMVITDNEALMKQAFSSPDNMRTLRAAILQAPEAEEFIMKGAIDWLRNKPQVIARDGTLDPAKVQKVLDQNQGIISELPANVRQKLTDELQLSKDYQARMAELDRRETALKDAKLDGFLAQAAAPDADPKQFLAGALNNPATMRMLVDKVGNDPDRLAAMRRAVYDIAVEGGTQGGALSSFINKNEKALQVLFKDSQHLNDLKSLADLQRRVYAFADVTGQIPSFDSMDNQLKNLFGFGVQYLTTTAREAAVGRINPSTGALALMLRIVGSAENTLYERMFTKAMEDKQFAHAITHVGNPEQATRAAQQLSGIGIGVKDILKNVFGSTSNAGRIARSEITEQTEKGRGPLPEAPRGTTARAMLQRALPPAPPVRGTQYLVPTPPKFGQAVPGMPPSVRSVPTAPPGGAGGGGGGSPSAQQMYQALFPRDPLSQMLQARQLQQQPPAPGQ